MKVESEGRKEKFFAEFIMHICRLSESKCRPLSFKEFLTEFNKKVLGKSTTSENIRELVANTKIDAETSNLIERLLVEGSDILICRNFFSLLAVTKTRISDQTMELLRKKTLERGIPDLCATAFCGYLSAMNISGQGGFLIRVINGLVEDKNFLAGDVAMYAADLGCVECYGSIKKILSSDDENPRAKHFARLAIEKLDSLKGDTE